MYIMFNVQYLQLYMNVLQNLMQYIKYMTVNRNLFQRVIHVQDRSVI